MGNVQMEAEQIRYKGSDYKNLQTAMDAALGGGGGSSTLSGLTDTDISTPTNGQVLTYDSTAEKWENASVAAGDVSYDNTASNLTADDVQAAIDEMIVNFQDGVDDVYDACVAKGSTPASHSLSDVITAIGNISSGGDILLYTIETKSSVGTTAAITVKKLLNGVQQSSTDYLYTDAATPVNIDNYLTIDYGVTSAQNWSYKLLQASLLNHAVDYVRSWRYSDTVSYGENFSV